MESPSLAFPDHGQVQIIIFIGLTHISSASPHLNCFILTRLAGWVRLCQVCVFSNNMCGFHAFYLFTFSNVLSQIVIGIFVDFLD